MKDNPLVSIIINNYNYGCFLPQAIDSALKQNYPHTEVVVVDDGSTDNSREIIINYGDQIISVLKANGGQASAFNVGFAASKGEIICILDSDDIFLPEKVAEIVDVFAKYPNSGWCFHPLRLVDVNTNTISGGRKEVSSQEYDLRANIREKGKMSLIHPATSGLCFTRLLLQQMLPMPESQGISIGDHYLKFVASGLSKGFYLNQELTLQKVHGNNTFTHRNGNQQVKGRIYVNTAHWMRINFPSLKKFTNNLFAVGIGSYWKAGGVETEIKEVVQTYLSSVSLLERFEINFRAFYQYVKQTIA